jgi:hypothetical protein
LLVTELLRCASTRKPSTTLSGPQKRRRSFVKLSLSMV